jgi:ATP-dependent DNA helicase RecG
MFNTADYSYLFSKVSDLLRLKPKAALSLERLGIESLRDILFYKPKAYLPILLEPKIYDLEPGLKVRLRVKIIKVEERPTNRSPISILAETSSGIIRLLYFNSIPKFILAKIQEKTFHMLSGKTLIYGESIAIIHPEFITFNRPLNSLEPLYPLTYGISNSQLLSYILKSLDIVKKASSSNFHLIQKMLNCLNVIHCNFNGEFKSLEEYLSSYYDEAIQILAEYELYGRKLLWNKIEESRKTHSGNSFTPNEALKKKILSNLKIEPTSTQLRAILEIEIDQIALKPMQRMLQGDVGSGKTLVAILTSANALSSSNPREATQIAVMAPTDLLANQHMRVFSEAFRNTEVEIELLTGAISTKNRKDILLRLKQGKIKILIGTHALFQDDIDFHKLGYVIIDEQHRFGVIQRMSLTSKGREPDLLIMTATPIPRSLALTIFRGMDISMLDEKPANRLPIITSITPVSHVNSIIEGLGRKIESGGKIFWVCSRISKSEILEHYIDSSSITDLETRYRDIDNLYHGRVGMLHGKMTTLEKDSIMNRFVKDPKFSILISTTVIEVGIDVPDATLIVIENAESFGLAQLHQLRGRVGRSYKQSHCIMIYDPRRMSETAKERLKIMRSSNDGFYIAEQDLQIRGGGEMIGIKQSGAQEFFFIDTQRHLKIIDTVYNNHDHSF